MHCLINEASKALVHGLVMSREDYGNAVLDGIAEVLMNKWQMVPNSAARLTARLRKRITPILIKLDWILVRWRV